MSETNIVQLPTTPSTIEGYTEFIQAQAARKGWSRNPHFLQLSCFKEMGELVKAIEHLNDDKPDKKTTPAQVMAEWADVQYFINQVVKVAVPDGNLDEALLAKMHDNEVKQKKTIDENGNLVRK